ncbi:hypothetical protein CC86DRAFT_213759 [Ophiobolus disseminans]|uniref:Uncharacterized protein n=1 Tax=Ophiobolus disseminans TaxID=1469910 RepID=A0A6A7A3B6_9PLEO|nr:hypothetical protein CC86DRAFT_213759 [Ophiobolus disseminans]
MCATYRYHQPCGYIQRRHHAICSDDNCTTTQLRNLVLPNGCSIWRNHACLKPKTGAGEDTDSLDDGSEDVGSSTAEGSMEPLLRLSEATLRSAGPVAQPASPSHTTPTPPPKNHEIAHTPSKGKYLATTCQEHLIQRNANKDTAPSPGPETASARSQTDRTSTETVGRRQSLKKKPGRVFTARDFERLGVGEEWEDA